MALSPDALHELLTQEMYVDEAVADSEFHHPQLAQYLERAVYVCPHCGLSEFESSGDVIVCKKCEQQIRYLPTKELQGINQPFPFRFVADWYDYQCDFISKLELTDYLQTPLYCDEVKMLEVIPYKHKLTLQENTPLRLYGDRIEVGPETAPLYTFTFDETDTVTVLGKNKINLYIGDKLYQFWGSQRFNALRYVNIFHHYQNRKAGITHQEFLGL